VITLILSGSLDNNLALFHLFRDLIEFSCGGPAELNNVQRILPFDMNTTEVNRMEVHNARQRNLKPRRYTVPQMPASGWPIDRLPNEPRLAEWINRLHRQYLPINRGLRASGGGFVTPMRRAPIRAPRDSSSQRRVRPIATVEYRNQRVDHTPSMSSTVQQVPRSRSARSNTAADDYSESGRAYMAMLNEVR
jgi:hypothetical protein